MRYRGGDSALRYRCSFAGCVNIRTCCCSRKYEQTRKMFLLFACLNREEFVYTENQKQQRNVWKGRRARMGEEKIKIAGNYEFHAFDRANVRLSLFAFFLFLNNQERARTRRRSMKTIICSNKNNRLYE